jgi:hypothetical protein
MLAPLFILYDITTIYKEFKLTSLPNNVSLSFLANKEKIETPPIKLYFFILQVSGHLVQFDAQSENRNKGWDIWVKKLRPPSLCWDNVPSLVGFSI